MPKIKRTVTQNKPPKIKRIPKKAILSPPKPAKKTTHKSTWKAFERTVAADFGTKRTPLSGSNGGVTSADTLHKKLFIEAKLRNKFSVHGLYQKTKELAKKENKTPVVAIKQKGCRGYLLVISPEDLETILNEYENGRD